MAELFGILLGRSTITEHLQNIFNEKELKKIWLVGISDK